MVRTSGVRSDRLPSNRAQTTESSQNSRPDPEVSRGVVQVLDRAGLEVLVNGSYGQAEREFRRLIVPLDRTLVDTAQ